MWKIINKNYLALFRKKFAKNCKKPLAVFGSWGIFLPVAGDGRDDNRRRPLSSGKVKSENENKKFSKKPLTKTKTVVN